MNCNPKGSMHHDNLCSCEDCLDKRSKCPHRFEEIDFGEIPEEGAFVNGIKNLRDNIRGCPDCNLIVRIFNKDSKI